MAYSEIDRLNGVIKLYYPTNKSVEKIEEWEEELNNYVVEIIPQNTLTLEQMKLLYVLFKQFSEGVEWYDIQLAKDYLKAEYGNIYELGDFLVYHLIKKLSDNRTISCLKLKYFDDMTHEYIAEKLNITERTVIRNKNYMIRQLQLMIFSNEVIKEIL